MMNRLVDGLLLAKEGRVPIYPRLAGRQRSSLFPDQALGSVPELTSNSGRNGAPYQLDLTTHSGERIVSFPQRSVHSADMEPGRCWPKHDHECVQAC
jgi:hypothetical protein